MRISEAFVLGAITGAVVVWLWGRQMEEYVEEKTREVRTKAAEGVRAVEETAGKVLDRVEGFVHHTRADVSEALQAGEDAIRPAPAARNA